MVLRSPKRHTISVIWTVGVGIYLTDRSLVATFLFNFVFVFSVTVFRRCFSLCFRFLASRRSFSALLWWRNNRKCFSPLLWSRSRRGWPLHGQFRFRIFNLRLFFLLFSLTVRLHSHSLWTYSQSCAQCFPVKYCVPKLK